MNKLINWFKQSNRNKHLYMGILIYLVYILLTIGLLLLTEDIILISTVIATISSITHMISVEYKDRLQGNKFDWLDILSGSIIPVLLTIGISIYGLLQSN